MNKLRMFTIVLCAVISACMVVWGTVQIAGLFLPVPEPEPDLVIVDPNIHPPQNLDCWTDFSFLGYCVGPRTDRAGNTKDDTMWCWFRVDTVYKTDTLRYPVSLNTFTRTPPKWLTLADTCGGSKPVAGASLSTGVGHRADIDHVWRHGRRFPAKADWVQIKVGDDEFEILRSDDYATLLAPDTVYVTPDTVFVTDTIRVSRDTCFNHYDHPNHYSGFVPKCTVYVTDTVTKKINIEDVLDGTGGPKWEYE